MPAKKKTDSNDGGSKNKRGSVDREEFLRSWIDAHKKGKTISELAIKLYGDENKVSSVRARQTTFRKKGINLARSRVPYQNGKT